MLKALAPALRSLHEQLRLKQMQKDYLAFKVRGQLAVSYKSSTSPFIEKISLQSG